MKQYLITKADSDWGTVFMIPNRKYIKATSFKVAFGRAASEVVRACRRRPKYLSIELRLIGTIRKVDPFLPADETTPERPL